MGGLLSLLTDIDDPRPMGISLSDHLAGMVACNGILAALNARHATGRGQRVDTSLLEATVSFVGENAARFFEAGSVPSRATRTHLAQVFAFVDGDGKPFVIHLSSPREVLERRAARRRAARMANRPAVQRAQGAHPQLRPTARRIERHLPHGVARPLARPSRTRGCSLGSVVRPRRSVQRPAGREDGAARPRGASATSARSIWSATACGCRRPLRRSTARRRTSGKTTPNCSASRTKAPSGDQYAIIGTGASRFFPAAPASARRFHVIRGDSPPPADFRQWPACPRPKC